MKRKERRKRKTKRSKEEAHKWEKEMKRKADTQKTKNVVVTIKTDLDTISVFNF